MTLEILDTKILKQKYNTRTKSIIFKNKEPKWDLDYFEGFLTPIIFPLLFSNKVIVIFLLNVTIKNYFLAYTYKDKYLWYIHS